MLLPLLQILAYHNILRYDIQKLKGRVSMLYDVYPTQDYIDERRKLMSRALDLYTAVTNKKFSIDKLSDKQYFVLCFVFFGLLYFVLISSLYLFVYEQVRPFFRYALSLVVFCSVLVLSDRHNRTQRKLVAALISIDHFETVMCQRYMHDSDGFKTVDQRDLFHHLLELKKADANYSPEFTSYLDHFRDLS